MTRRGEGTADDLDERAALVETGAGVPRTWAEGYAALCAMPPPPGFIPKRWPRVIDAAGNFLDRWGDTAIACGWSTFGLCLLLDRCEVVAVDEHGADLVTHGGATQRFRRHPLPPGTISLWELRKGDEP